ncbi:hypothetical protein [Streptomyces sp. A1547]|uniref:hypothetical protein n=1 Tax=Streptomyces sp. A1547 TaxID=2563105 RepID=UPI00109E4DDB|nr:hypothetical protein [Streptomyces sp. A1547]THA33729.1 hypothetical protein E6W17_31015 [Streptomyces sp. A1547]
MTMNVPMVPADRVHFCAGGFPPRPRGNPSGVDRDQESSSGGRISKHVGWWIAALAGLAGIAGLIFAILTWDRFTVDDWVKVANAACDDLHGQVVKEFREAESSLVVLVDGGYQPVDYQTAATAWDALAATERQLTSGLGKIETPDSHEKEIAVLLEAMNDVSDQDEALAGELRKEVVRRDSQIAVDIAEKRREYVDQTNARLTKLKVKHCLAGE